jgi:hypothetical protein
MSHMKFTYDRQFTPTLFIIAVGGAIVWRELGGTSALVFCFGAFIGSIRFKGL